MSRSCDNNDLMIKLSSNKLLLMMLIVMKRLLKLQKRLIIMHAIRENFV